MNTAELLGWEIRIGAIEAGKFPDLIAVDGDPLKEIGELQNVKFVMKGARPSNNSGRHLGFIQSPSVLTICFV